MALPLSLSLKSVYNNKYLRYRNDYDAVSHGLLQFAADALEEQHAQFDVEKAQNSDELVHIKSRLTQRYLVRWSPNHWWITAWADAPDEDQNSWACTLFKPIFIDNDGDNRKIRLMHVQLGHYACLWRADAPFDSCLFAGSSETDQDSCDVFTVVADPQCIPSSIVPYEPAFKIPKYVAFKGYNGNYLVPYMVDGKPYLQFSFSGFPEDNMEVIQEIFQSNDGTFHIKSVHLGKFWRVGEGNWVLADADDPRGTNNTATMFRAAVQGICDIGLLNMETTKFCQLLTHEQVDNCMSSTAESINYGEAMLEIENLGNLNL